MVFILNKKKGHLLDEQKKWKQKYTLNVINFRIELWLSKNAKTWVRSLEKIKKLDQIKLNSSSFFLGFKKFETLSVNIPS